MLDISAMLGEKKISMESIETQTDTAIVTVIDEHINEIYKLIDKLQYNDPMLLHNDKDFKNIIKSLDSKISDRFGINFNHILSLGINYSVFTVPFTNTILEKNFDKTLKELMYNFNGETEDKVKNSFDYNKLGNSIVKSSKSIRKTLTNSTIKANFKTARIEGLNEDYIINIGVDFIYNKKQGFKVEQLTSLLLHEIGHAFDHIALSYKTVTVNEHLVDSIMSSRNNDNYVEKVIEYSLDKDVTNENTKVDVSKQSDVIEMFVRITNRTVRDITTIDNNNTKVYLNDETLADMFASRFGRGLELSQAVELSDRKMDYALFNTSLFLFTVYSIYFVILNGFVLGLLVFQSLFVLAGLIGKLIVEFMFGDTNTSTISKYENPKYRVNNIKLDLIRQLKQTDLDRKEKKALINQIDEVIEIVERTDTGSSIGKVLSTVLIPSRRAAYKRFSLDTKIIEMVDNELFLINEKIKGKR